MLLKKRLAVFLAAVLLILAAAGVVVGIGLWTGTLPQDSLAFRWNYWVGGWGVFLDHPLLGTGFANFGDAYLLHRRPVAAEEVSDPHNLIVRFFAETGLVGGLLAVLWLGWTGWELLRPAKAVPDESPSVAVPALAWVLVLAVGLNVLLGVDLTSDPGYVLLEIVRKLLFAALLAMGLFMGCLRSAQDPRVSPRPGLAMSSLMIAGLLAILLHAMADVVLFEVPVLMTFVLLLGASLGIRAPHADPGRLTRFALAGLVSLLLAALAAGWAVPTTLAEVRSAEGDALAAGRPACGGGGGVRRRGGHHDGERRRAVPQGQRRRRLREPADRRDRGAAETGDRGRPGGRGRPAAAGGVLPQSL